jgi:hypothetical protein
MWFDIMEMRARLSLEESENAESPLAILFLFYVMLLELH